MFCNCPCYRRNNCCCGNDCNCRNNCYCGNNCNCRNNCCCRNDCNCNCRNNCCCRNDCCCRNNCYGNTCSCNFINNTFRESRLRFDNKPRETLSEQEHNVNKETVKKINQIKFYKNLLLNGICGIEFINQKYNPLDLNLKDWSKNFAANIDDYANVLDKFYEKYKHIKSEELSPECKLMLQVATDGIIHHLSQQLFGNRNPIDLSKFINTRNNPSAFVDVNGTVFPRL